MMILSLSPNKIKSNKANDGLRTIVANAMVLFIKLNTIHYLIKGLSFREVHIKTERYYDYMESIYDELNERLVQMGDIPIKSLGCISKYRHMIEDFVDNSCNTIRAYETIYEDFKVMLSLIGKELDRIKQTNDVVTEDILIEYKKWFSKEIWMLKATVDI